MSLSSFSNCVTFAMYEFNRDEADVVNRMASLVKVVICTQNYTVCNWFCTQCNFVYYGQTERSLKTRIAEHKTAVASFDQNSKVASHVYQFSHNINFASVKVVGVVSNYHERLFLEALHSTVEGSHRWEGSHRTPRSPGPEAYKDITRAWITWSRAQASRYVTLNSVW